MNEFEIEVQDDINSNPEHKIVTVTTAGTPITVSRADAKNTTLLLIKNASRGNNANSMSTVIYISTDGTTNYISINRGEAFYIPGYILNNNIKVDSNVNGAKAEIVLWG